MLTNLTNGKTMESNRMGSEPQPGFRTVVLKDGKLTLNVGATLKVGMITITRVGLYSGTYAITVSYN
jgi:hypothetical protein